MNGWLKLDTDAVVVTGSPPAEVTVTVSVSGYEPCGTLRVLPGATVEPFCVTDSVGAVSVEVTVTVCGSGQQPVGDGDRRP